MNRERLSYFQNMLKVPERKLIEGKPFVLAELGNGEPILAVTGGMHGNEDYGVKIIADLRKEESVKRGTLRLIVANVPALIEGKRYLQKDLNRIFPGVEGLEGEEGLAPQVSALVEDATKVLDLHTSASNCPTFAILGNNSPEKIALAEAAGVENIILFPREQRYAMVDFAQCGIGLELGPHGTEYSYTQGKKAVRNVEGYMGLTHETPSEPNERKYFRLIGKITSEDVDTPFERALVDFQLISAGQPIGYNSSEDQLVTADRDFYPIFVGVYPGIVCQKVERISRDELIKGE